METKKGIIKSIKNALTEQRFDLTTKNGLTKAASTLEKFGWVISPVGWLVYKAFSPEVTTHKQVEAAERIIETCKQQGVKKIVLNVSHKAGLALQATLKGLPISSNIGNNSNMEIEIEF